MKNYANGSYVREHRRILKHLGFWKQMTAEEQAMFNICHQCEGYNEYLKNECKTPCPCATCEHRKTEIQVDNRMVTLRKKYFEGGI